MSETPPGFAPAVSVIIPAATADDDLAAQLRAVATQDLEVPYEIIVVLNSADDVHVRRLAGVIADVGARDDRPMVVHQAVDRRGAAYARNQGVNRANAPILAFCDADDLVRPDWLRRLLPAVSADTAAGGHLAEFIDTGELPKWRPPLTPDGLPTFLDVPYLVSANMAVTRTAFDDAGGFDETLTRCEDIAFSWQLVRRGHHLIYVADAVVDYRVRGSVGGMLRQHYYYGIGMSEVLARDGRPGSAIGAGMLRPNNQAGGLRSPIAVLRKAAIGAGRVIGSLKERRSAN